MKPTWAIQRILGQHELQSEIMSQKTSKSIKIAKTCPKVLKGVYAVRDPYI